jgi:HTH-type transcriptional regulator/antitoxin HigA
MGADHEMRSPGQVLLQALSDRKVSQAELARRLGKSRQYVNQLVRDESRITPRVAIALEQLLGTPAGSWANLQAEYDLGKARLRRGTQT